MLYLRKQKIIFKAGRKVVRKQKKIIFYNIAEKIRIFAKK